MQKHSQGSKNQAYSLQKSTKESTLSIFDFFHKAKETIAQKSEVALNKIQRKLEQDPAVFKLPLQNRKKLLSKEKTVQKLPLKSLSKQKPSQSAKSNGQFTDTKSERLHQLMKKRHDLMARLRKIDQELHNPSLLPVTIQPSNNNSFLHTQFDKLPGMESRIQIGQKNAYNLTQHQKTVEMLTRINNQKMRRQEKIVEQMKKKQENELKKLKQIEKNKSRLQLSRHQRVLPTINRRQSERQAEADSAKSSKKYMSAQPEAHSVENQFQQIQEDRKIGNYEGNATQFEREQPLEEHTS